MSYIKAEDILPEELILKIQQYVDGQVIYIPRKRENRRAWGCSSGYRVELEVRNCHIRLEFQQGCSIDALAQKYHLSEKSIRRILRST